MRMNLLRFIVPVLCFLPLFFSSVDARAESFTLEQALRQAYEHSPQMRQARQWLKAKKGLALQSKTLPDPVGEISIGGLRKDEAGKRNSEVGSYSVKQPLGVPGAQLLQWQIAGREVTAGEAGLELAWGQVRTEVVSLYSRILFQAKAVDLSRNNLDSVRQFTTFVENRFQSGSAPRTELTRAKIEVLRAENEILTGQEALNVSKGELNLLLGRKPDAPLELTDDFGNIDSDKQYPDLLAQALANRADIKIAGEQLQIARKHLAQSRLQAVLPETAVGFERTMEDYENDSSVLLEFSYPLWGFNQGRVKEASANRDSKNIELAALKEQVAAQVYKAFADTQLAQAQVNLNKKSLDEANELLRQITMGYQEGDIPFLAFLENLKTVKETRLSYLQAIHNAHEKHAQLQMAVQETPIPGGQSE